MPEFIPFRFKVSLYGTDGNSENLVCQGAFSEVTGFEATMTPKTITEGGRNWGEVHLAGPTKFPPVIFKRGVTEISDLDTWFDITTRQANYAYRMNCVIEVLDQQSVEADQSPKALLTWTLVNVMATKFKGPDLSSTSSQVAIEELHIVHEGMTLERRPPKGAGNV